MGSTRNIVLAFDAYGTLLDTYSIADQLAKHVGQTKARSISAAWRKYQLEYTWRLNSMGKFESFDTVTRKALDHALSEAIGFFCDDEKNALMESYSSLSTFDDVTPMIEQLEKVSSITPVVFSNGTSEMITNSVKNSPDLGPHSHVFKQIVTVDAVRKFKPAPEVYLYLAEQVGKTPAELKDIWLVSGNPFDVVGARGAGLNAIWVDRGGNGWTDRMALEKEYQPTEVVRGLDKVLSVIERHQQ